MEQRVSNIINNAACELIWFLQHPSIYTAGTSANENDLLAANFPVIYSGRGGKYTYHGPGQRVIYLILDLKKRNLCDIKKYIFLLEEIIIKVLETLSIKGQREQEAPGVWISSKNSINKIAAIGVRIKKWVSYHGVAFNLNPNLLHYSGIIPCGIKEKGVTSLWEMGYKIPLATLDKLLKKEIDKVFS